MAVKNRQLAEVIEDRELELFVEKAEVGAFEARRGERSWRRVPPQPGQLTTEWRGDMRSAWPNVLHMSKMLQVRNVPDELHRTLKVRAAQNGLTLSDYVLGELRAIAEKPTLTELLQELSERETQDLGTLPQDLIRELRGPLP